MSGHLHADIQLRRGAFRLSAQFSAPLNGVTALFGPSGSGKSLLLSALAGLQKLDAGRIALADRVLDDIAREVRTPAHLRGVGLVFQDARLFPHLSVRGNLDYAVRRAAGLKPLLSPEEAAAQFDFTALLDRPVRNLSGGERSRVALARALLSAPDLLLLDEPFAALDGARRASFLATLRELHTRYALPILVVTHQIDDVAALADTIIGLRDGAVVGQGALTDISTDPAIQNLLDRRDIGAAIPASAFANAGEGRGGAVWVRADHVLLASVRPQGLSARNIWEARVRSIRTETSGSVLVQVDAPHTTLLSRITPQAASELALAEGAAIWAVIKTHSI